MTVEITRWWWVRHAPVTANDGRLYGQRDLPCETDDNVRFTALAGHLPEESVLVTSNLQRTTQTAAAIADAGLSMPNPVVEPDLREQSFGDWQGKLYEEIWPDRDLSGRRLWPAPAHERAPGGESFADLMSRSIPVIARLSEAHRGRDIIAVTHGGTIRAAVGFALGLDPETALRLSIENLSVSRLDHIFTPTGIYWRVVTVNHLP